MKSYWIIEENETHELKRFLTISAGAHVLLLVLFLWNPKGVFTFRFNKEEFLPAVRVDVVDLPDILKKDLKKIEIQERKNVEHNTAPPKKKKAPVDDGLSFKKKQNVSKQRNKALEKLREDLKRRQAIQKLREKKAKEGLVLKGNIKSDGGALTGEQLAGANAYVGRLTTHLKRRWKIPVWLQKKNLSARLYIWVGPSGELLKLQMSQPSGNAEFDKYVLRTAELSVPFPPPPDDLVLYFSSEGFEVGFP